MAAYMVWRNLGWEQLDVRLERPFKTGIDANESPPNRLRWWLRSFVMATNPLRFSFSEMDPLSPPELPRLQVEEYEAIRQRLRDDPDYKRWFQKTVEYLIEAIYFLRGADVASRVSVSPIPQAALNSTVLGAPFCSH